MIMGSCQNCVFKDMCEDNRPCRHFSPVDDNEGYDLAIIEAGRKQFAKEWNQYLSEAQPSDF